MAEPSLNSSPPLGSIVSPNAVSVPDFWKRNCLVSFVALQVGRPIVVCADSVPTKTEFTVVVIVLLATT